MGLTASDTASGLQAHVVGVKADGSRCILDSFPVRQRNRAERRAEEFRRWLEGYKAIVVETETAPVPEQSWQLRPWKLLRPT